MSSFFARSAFSHLSLSLITANTLPKKRPPSALPDQPGRPEELGQMLCCGLHYWKNNSSCLLVTSQMEQTSRRAECQPQLWSQLEPELLRIRPLGNSHKPSMARRGDRGPAKGQFHPASTCPEAPPVHPVQWHEAMFIFYLSHECKSLAPSEVESSV